MARYMPGCTPWREGAKVKIVRGVGKGLVGKLDVRVRAPPNKRYNSWKVTVGKKTLTTSQTNLLLKTSAVVAWLVRKI